MYVPKIEEVCRDLQCLLIQTGVVKLEDDGRLREREREKDQSNDALCGYKTLMNCKIKTFSPHIQIF